MKKVIRWGIVGAGAAAHRFARGLAHVPDAQLRAVWSRNPVTTLDLAVQEGAHACLQLDALLEYEIDAIYIATLPDSHARYAEAALRAGKHVLCEKPVTQNTAELQSLIQIAKLHELLFMEAMKPPFYPVYKKLHEHLIQDPIGQVSFVRAGYATADAPPSHPSFRPELGGGSLMGIGVYQIFLAVDWLGHVHQVQALGTMGQTAVDTFAILQTRHQDGFAQMFSGLELSGPGDAVLAGPSGFVTIHSNWWNPSEITIRYRDGREIVLREPVVGGGFNYETAHFCELIREGMRESPIMTHQKSIQIMQVLDDARRLVHP